MSLEVLDGSEEPDRRGSQEGLGDFISMRQPSLDVYRPEVTLERLGRTVPASRAMIYLAKSLAE